jgi:polysaccharide deacetylase family protein (PEP-CTERM system associated)
MSNSVHARSVHAMSVDVEDYLHAWALSPAIGRADWERWPSRVEASTRRVLDLFEAAGIKATFFVLGWVAARHPALVREIAGRGHELASHGYHHEKVFEQRPEAFFQDVQRSRALLEDQAGTAVLGYRAPSFSIDRRCWWAYDRLAEAGYRYSSSLHSISHDHYGMPDAPLTPFSPTSSPLTEIPVATIDLLGRRQTCAGGGHFRVFPYAWSRWCLRRLETDGRKGVFYFHPWEIDPGQPRVPGLPLRSRLRHYTNLGRMAAKLERLLADFAFDRIDRLFGLGEAAAAKLAGEAA